MSCNVSSELVTVAVFTTSADAELVRAQLTAAGIESQLTAGRGAVQAGQVHVQVAQGDFEGAMRLLFPVPEPARAPTSEVGSWTCPKCGQSVFDFSNVCWMCGTSREGAPPAPIAPGTITPGTEAPGTDAPGTATIERPESTDAISSPSSSSGSATAPSLPGAAAPRMPRFAQFPLPPPPGMVPATEPPPDHGGAPLGSSPAVPRFARHKPATISPVELSEPQPRAGTGAVVEPDSSAEHGASAEASAPAGLAPPIEPALESAVAESHFTASPLPNRLVNPLGWAPPARARVDAKQKEIESMTRWALWTAVVGVLVCPAAVYSVWVLLTLTFAGARPSRAGRLRFVGAWFVNVAVIVVWYVFLQTHM